MFITKKCLYLVFMLCFLISSFSFQLWADEGAKKALDRHQDKSRQEQAPTQDQPRISFDDVGYDAGSVWEGEKIAHTFTVKNTGTAQLNIDKVKAG